MNHRFIKEYLLPLFILISVSMLAYGYALFSFLLLLIIALSLVVVLITGFFRIFRRSISPNWLRMPVIIIAICVLGITIGLFRPFEPAIVHADNVSETLAYAYNTDQADRKTFKSYLGMFRNKVILRDSIRLDQVQQLYKEQQITKPLDKFHAAFIFHHGKKSSLYEIAYKLASEAASVNELQDVYQVQWLAKATYDRWLVSLGKSQKYGTQGKFSVSVE